ncbi:coiled-coil protein [Legionella nautarum]|uniref:Coiled-coil protein n=1 Tax=Legionella nautarum TaxID=45070 RepID=A0A0W0X2U3_9GAMM|nr:C2 family cysteine protease [Legionella nautarum]KTD38866.1 coiled-coil protein [Legionella nautarum]
MPSNVLDAPNPKGGRFFFSISHAKTTESIYPPRLAVDQIKQGGNTGNCFLLSVINAILALPEGESYIRQLLIEKSDKVYVHFFQDDKPMWIAVEKSLPTNWGLLSSGALALMSGDYDKTLKAGDARQVLRTFLGGFDTYIAPSIQSRTTVEELYNKRIYGCSGEDIYSFIFLLRPYDRLATEVLLIKHIFSDDKSLLNDWWDWVAQDPESWKKLVSGKELLFEEEVLNFIDCQQQKSKDSPLKAILAVKQWLIKNKLLPGKNHYSKDELIVYSALVEAHKAQQPIVASPKAKASEGLIAQHSYAVLGFTESKMTHRKFVILRNPYAEDRWITQFFLPGGRQAKEVIDNKGEIRLEISTTSRSTFKMELRDFSQAFAYIDSGNSLNKIKIEQLEEDSPSPSVVRLS